MTFEEEYPRRKLISYIIGKVKEAHADDIADMILYQLSLKLDKQRVKSSFGRIDLALQESWDKEAVKKVISKEFKGLGL